MNLENVCRLLILLYVYRLSTLLTKFYNNVNSYKYKLKFNKLQF